MNHEPRTGRARVWLTALSISAALLASACSRAHDSRPNIIVILADDLGWGDVGYHGSSIATPNIDRLAAESVRLESFYGMPMCTPARAALLTGRHPMRMRLQEDVLRPWSRGGLPRDERTLAEVLRDAGYRTSMLGKWHLGHRERELLPLARGFEHHYGSYCGLIDYFSHERLEGLDWHRDGKALVEPGHTTELITREAERILSDDSDERPLFLYVAFNAPHAPPQAPLDCAELYTSSMPQPRAGYAAQVACLDRALGRILAALDESGERKETLIVFASDNGGDRETGGENAPLRGEKGSLYEGAVRVVALANWPGTLAPRTLAHPLHMVDWLPTFAQLGRASLAGCKPLDGRSIWTTLVNAAPTPRDELLINVESDGGAIRVGDWKLVARGAWPVDLSAAPQFESLELYDLASDPGEARDVADTHAEIVESCLARLVAYAREADLDRASMVEKKPADFVPPRVWGE